MVDVTRVNPSPYEERVHAVGALLAAERARKVAKDRLRVNIMKEYETRGVEVPRKTVVDLLVDVRGGQELETRLATGDLIWARNDVVAWASVEVAENTRRLVEQNDEIIRLLGRLLRDRA